jgi:hypothetical protein
VLLPGILWAAEQKKIEKGAVPPSPGIILRPDLVVDRVWLDGRCAVMFSVRNTGPGMLPENEHARGMVRVSIGKAQKDYPFQVVDGEKALIHPGRAVSFNTQAVMDGPDQVLVIVDAAGAIPETNEGNNSRQENLRPECKKEAAPGLAPRSAPGAAQPAASPQAALPMMKSAQRPPAGSSATMDPGGRPLRMQAPHRAGLPTAKEVVNIPVDVFEPRAAALLHQGGVINVRWEVNPSVSRDIPLPSSFYVDLYDENRGGPWMPLYQGLNRQVRAIVPTDIADSDGYIVRLWGVTYVEGTDTSYVFQGYSRRFRIERANGIVLIQPSETSPTTPELTLGRSYTIEWNCTGTFADPVDIKVLTADGVNRDNLALRRPCADRRLTWQVGRGWTGLHSADRLYRIRVESSRDRNVRAESVIFRINLPPPFVIGSPSRGARWPRYSRQTISFTGGDGSTRLRIALFKAGEHYSDIVRNLHPSFRSLDWRVSYGYSDYAAGGGGLTGAPLATGTMGGVALPAGGDYQIKVSQEGAPFVYTLSEMFAITD